MTGRPLLHRHPGESRRRFSTAKLVIQRLALRCTSEAGFVAASYLPVCSRDRAAYATGASLACRRPSHTLFASPKTLSPRRSSPHRHPGEGRRRFSTAKLVIQRLAASSYGISRFRDDLALARELPRPGRLRNGRFTRLQATESYSLC